MQLGMTSRASRLFLAAFYVTVGVVSIGGAVNVIAGDEPDAPLRGELASMETRIRDEQVRAAALEAEIEAFRTRREVREHVARSELGVVRKGERVFVFKPHTGSNDGKVAPAEAARPTLPDAPMAR